MFKRLILAALPLMTGCTALDAIRPTAQSAAPSAPTATGDTWFDAGQRAVYERKMRKAPPRRAKNVILFVGDGMDINTVTAARIYDGQSRGEDGEGNALFFETFPSVAFSKTYTTSHQVPDSAGTASAMVTGVKTKSGVLSIAESVSRRDCAGALANPVKTIAERAEEAGLSTGVVSTAELTHATPGAAYAHSADRGWGADSELTATARALGCRDIARQLIEFDYGDGLEIALGGGRANFLPTEMNDPEYPERQGKREDGRNLPQEWAAKSPEHAYVWNLSDFDALDADRKLLGLFEPSHMHYEADRADDGAGEPSLAQMTARAIDTLSKNEEGFFLLVEAGRIDHAHHAGNAYRALRDTQAYAEAVRTAREMTSDQDTLIIVTADHGHTMAIAGYSYKGANILGLSTGKLAAHLAGDNKPYTTLGYLNGPGSVFSPGQDTANQRPAPTSEGAQDRNYLQQSLVPTGSETHGGQDVPIYASGPNSDLVSGVMEQNVIYHIMADALGL